MMKHGGDANEVALYVQSVRNILLQPEMKLVDDQIKRCKTGFISGNGQKNE